MVAFTNASHVQSGLIGAGALTAGIGGSLVFGAIDAMRAARDARLEAYAYAAWDNALGDARRDARAMGDLAKAAVVAALDAQDEAEELRAEVVRLRRAVDQRDAAIRALA